MTSDRYSLESAVSCRMHKQGLEEYPLVLQDLLVTTSDSNLLSPLARSPRVYKVKR